MVVCGQCGLENAAGARFCNGCAALLAAPAAEVRKTVTVVFCDLVGSTALGERTDPEVLRALMGRYHGECRRILESHGGTVEKFVGDAAMAVFGIPHVHEDDALRAVRAAVAMRDAVGALGLEVRIGVNTGEVVAGTGETLVTGDAVNVAARLEQTAASHEILIGAQTERLVREHVALEPVEPLTVKGKSEPLPAFRVVNLLHVDKPEYTSPFVGRESELDVLDGAMRLASDKRVPQLVTIVGDPGIGKSRLVAEVLRAVDGEVLVGRCLSYGDAITYWPVVEILEGLGELDAKLAAADDAALVSVRLAAAVGTPGAAASPDEIAWAFRRLIESLARDRLLVVVFDDIHWAEPTLLDLIEYVATFAQDTPLLVLCTARPDLFDVRPDWLTPRPNSSVIRLEALDLSHADVLVNELGDVPVETRRRIVEAADGNPLFVEQLVAMHLESPATELEIPPNLHALLSARIDRLEAEERVVVERASVEGRLFHRGAVVELLPEQDRRDVGMRLMHLVRREFIRPDHATLQGDDGFRFGHILIRDAAYESVPKRVRAELHEKYAEWLARRLGDDAPPEILGYHYEQAYGYTRELSENATELGDRAAHYLARGANAAHLRQDVSAALRLYDRALGCVSNQYERARLLIALAEARDDAGDLDGMADAIALAQEVAVAIGDRSIEQLTQLHTAYLRLRRQPEGAVDAAIAVAQRVLDSTPDDEHRILSRAWGLLVWAHNVRGRHDDMMRAIDRAMQHARAVGDLPYELGMATAWGGAIVYGPVSVEDGQRKIEELDADLGHIPSIQAFVAHVRAHLAARRGDFAGAAEMLNAWRSHLREVGEESMYLQTAGCVWDILSLAQDYETGERALREANAMLGERGERAGRSGIAALQAHAEIALGRLDEAEELVALGRELAAPEDAMTHALCNCALAKVHAARGRHDEAISSAREGVEIADRTDMLDMRADCHLDLAAALRASGDEPSARAAAAEAAALYARKGNEVGMARANAFTSAG